MRYREPDEEHEYEGQTPPIGIPQDPKVAGLRWSNEIEPRKNVIDTEFLKRNRLLVMDASKFLPLGNIRDKKTVKLLRLRRMNMIMEMDAGLDDLAEQTAMSNLADIQTSRAASGFNAKLEVTQRKEWIESGEKEKKRGLFARIQKRREEEETAGELLE